MLPQLAGRWERLERERQALLRTLRGLSEAQLAFHPAPGAWSLRDVAEHLLRVDTAVERQSRASPPPDTRRSLRQQVGRGITWLIFRLGVRVPMPVRGLAPTGELDLEQIDEQWDGVRAALHARMQEVVPATQTDPVFVHPLAGPLDAPATLDFLRCHFEHHLRQAARIRAAAGLPE